MNNQPYPNKGNNSPQTPPPYHPQQNGGYSPNNGYPPNGGYGPNGYGSNGPNAAYGAYGPQPNQPYQSQNIHYCADGKYRWVYEMHMMKNPILMITVYKAFGLTFIILWVIMAFISLISGDGLESVMFSTKVVLIIIAIFVPLIFLAFLLVAAMNGWKYVVMFEMDEHGLLHRQLQKQVKKAKAIGWLAVIAGLLGGNRGAASAGFVAATKQELYSDFSAVRSVKAKRGFSTIKVNETLTRNQAYASKEDFDFVYQYILAHCPRLKQ